MIEARLAPCASWGCVIRSWNRTVFLTAWLATVLGALSASVLALTLGPGYWWLVELSAFLCLIGAFVTLEQIVVVRTASRQRDELLTFITRFLPDVLFEATPDGAFTRVSRAAVRVLGAEPRALRGVPINEFTEDVMPSITGERAVSWTTRWRAPDGTSRPLNTILYPVYDKDGRLRAIRGVIRDQAERLAAETALRDSEARFRRVLDAAQNGVMLVSLEGELLLTNDALRTLLGWQPGEPRSQTLADVVHPAFVDQLMALMASRAWSDAAPSHYEVQLVSQTGDLIDVEVSLAAFREAGRTTGVLIEVRDLTEARRTSEAIRRMADYDRLTGLPNRDLFERHLQRALIDARAAGTQVAVVLLDLDRFKLINDTLGHPSGDRLLKAIAERLRGLLPPRYMLARFSGDEYLVLVPELTSTGQAEAAARRVLATFAQPFEVDGHQLQVATTAGVGIYPAHAEDADTLVRIADAALHEAKAEGGNRYRLGSNDANDPARRRLELEGDLRQAVEQGDLWLAYQPQVDPESGEVRGLEALLRWTHPVRGEVGPAEFVPLLEETGLIVEVGDFVLREACAQARRWRDAGHRTVRVAVNLSPRQFLVSDLDQRVRAALEASGLEPDSLEVELTETSGMLDLEAVSGVLNALIDLGVTTAIDDFGIGQSWLGRLQQLSIRTLKVDRSFVQRVVSSGSDFAIVEAVVALGHALGMTVVAEGVETQEQLDVVRAIGCDLVQGFYYAPALTPEAVEEYLVEGFYREVEPDFRSAA